MAKPQSTPPKLPRFALPEPAIARHPGVMLAPRELRSWAETLPFGNPPRAAQLMMQQLRLLVRDPEPGPKLGNLLALYEEPTRRLLDIVNERLLGNPDHAVPLDQLEHALLDLLTELSYGHLRIANDLLAVGKLPQTALLYHALDLLDTARNIERMHYCASGIDKWRLVLAIYQHAETRGIDAESIDPPTRRSGEPGSIKGLFFRTLVTGLCDPHRHRPGALKDWHDWTGRHAHTLELSVLPQGAFSIPVDTSGGLQLLTGARRGKPGPEMRYLAAETFLRTLYEDPNAPDGLYETLSNLIKGRKSPEQRRGPRQPRDHAFRLLHGLRNVHGRLTELTSGMVSTTDISAPIECRQTNQSKSGAAFRAQGPLNPPLGIGEVILAEADNPKPGGAPVGFIGRIQRLVSADNGQIEIGVEKIAGRIQPVSLSGGAAERARGDTYGLLQQATDTGRSMLLAPYGVYREDDSIAVESANARHKLRMKGLQVATQRIAYIEVDVVG